MSASGNEGEARKRELTFVLNTSALKLLQAPFSISGDGQWSTVAIPFSQFSNDWSPFTGACGTVDPTGKAHRCCNSTYPEVCLKSKNLADITQIGLWVRLGGGVVFSFFFSSCVRRVFHTGGGMKVWV